MNSCECCFTDFLAKCETEIVINTNLTPGNTYRWVISDKFGHLYEGTADAEDDGSLIIPIEDVPAGIFTQYSSDFNLQIYSENSCSPIKFKLTGEYDCVTFNIHGGTFVKNTIGCETTFELAEGGTVPTLAQVLNQSNDANDTEIVNVLNPTGGQSAATKQYVDSEIAAIPTPTLAQVLAAGNEGGGLEILGISLIGTNAGGGLILEAPDTGRWLVTVDNAGALQTVSV